MRTTNQSHAEEQKHDAANDAACFHGIFSNVYFFT